MIGWLTLATWNFQTYVRLLAPNVKFKERDPRVSMSSPEAVRHVTQSEKSALNSDGRTEILEPVSIKKFLERRWGKREGEEKVDEEKDLEKTEMKKGLEMIWGGEW